jgi:hypothetical protein
MHSLSIALWSPECRLPSGQYTDDWRKGCRGFGLRIYPSALGRQGRIWLVTPVTERRSCMCDTHVSQHGSEDEQESLLRAGRYEVAVDSGSRS